MRFIFVNRFFYPDHSATSQILSDLTFALARRGHSIAVVTSRLDYDGTGKVHLRPRENIEGVAVNRVWTSRLGRAWLPGRAIDYATFYLASAWRLWRVARSGDVVIAKTDPPMLSVIVAPICWLRGAKLVNWLQDIFPETAQALGVAGRFSRAGYTIMRMLRNRSLKLARMNVTLGERMAERVESFGVPRDRIAIIANWADGAAVRPIDHASNGMRARWGLSDSFVVGYSGNLGRAHEIDTILRAMTTLERAERGAKTDVDQPSGAPAPPVTWRFIGSGALLAPLQSEVSKRGLQSVAFHPYQPRWLLAASLSAADVHLVSLRPELEGLIVPSKFYGICAAGRPTLFVGDQDGEIARLIARYGCGRSIAAGDGEGLAQVIVELIGNASERRRMGEAARRALEEEFDKSIAVTRWEKLLVAAARSDA